MTLSKRKNPLYPVFAGIKVRICKSRSEMLCGTLDSGQTTSSVFSSIYGALTSIIRWICSSLVSEYSSSQGSVFCCTATTFTGRLLSMLSPAFLNINAERMTGMRNTSALAVMNPQATRCVLACRRIR